LSNVRHRRAGAKYKTNVRASRSKRAREHTPFAVNTNGMRYNIPLYYYYNVGHCTVSFRAIKTRKTDVGESYRARKPAASVQCSVRKIRDKIQTCSLGVETAKAEKHRRGRSY